jgi:anti-sigma factor RsiW
MSSHLTSEQMTEAVLGDYSRDVGAHLRECAACHAEVRRWQSDLSAFGSAVRNWSEAEATAAPVRRKAARWRAAFPRPFSVVAVCASILLLCVLAEFHHFGGRDLSRSAAVTIAEPSDAVLMQDVNAELSRTVPGPMEPLSNPSVAR